MRYGAWVVAAVFCISGMPALAQDAPPAKPGLAAKPAAPQMVSGEQAAKFRELNQRINALLRETAESNPEIKKLFAAQQARWLDINKKRGDILAATPELKLLRETLDAKRAQERDLVNEIAMKNPELAEMRRQYQALEQKYNAKMREMADASPALATLHKVVGDLQGKLAEAMESNPELKKMDAEAEASWVELLKKAEAASPELAAAVGERNAMMAQAAPPGAAPGAPAPPATAAPAPAAAGTKQAK
jgi:chromosome segregation ATPase